MPKTLTILMLSGYQENEDPIFALGLAKAVLKAGYGVNMFLFGNAANMANKDTCGLPKICANMWS